jgi:DNA/RNA-binding domain of Phe-tRNA-synthetase-like protein
VIDISIDSSLRRCAADLALGVIRASVRIGEQDSSLSEEIQCCLTDIRRALSIEMLADLPELRALRETYRRLGKDPSRYRGSQEALLRRILQGKDLYRINNVVDINNLVSLRCRHSVGSYDLARITSPIVIRVGRNGEYYKGLGKGTIDIRNLPIFCDDMGPFGSPTSDSDRAPISPNTTHILMIIIAFSGMAGLDKHILDAERLLSKFAGCADGHCTTAIIS